LNCEQEAPRKATIQTGAIPGILAGRDLIGCAQTGTGKTAAFTLPILHRLRAGARGRLRALILTPTRELALQIAEAMRVYGRHLPLTTAVVHGGVGIDAQRSRMRRGVDILVATPGRLLDLMERGSLDYRNLEVLVLDEADRMLDMGFIRDVRRIIASLPARRQTLLFSATMPDAIRSLAREIQRDPLTVEVAARRSAPAAGVRQALLPVDTARKRDLLAHLLQTEARGLTLVFTRTKHGANKLARTSKSAATRWRCCTAIAASRSATTRWRRSAADAAASWSRPTSPGAASTWTAARTWSITICRTSPRTTCTASAAPRAPAPPATPSPWCHPRTTRTSAASRS
jgi:ATP-dependent RNA helicase RhlE